MKTEEEETNNYIGSKTQPTYRNPQAPERIVGRRQSLGLAKRRTACTTDSRTFILFLSGQGRDGTNKNNVLKKTDTTILQRRVTRR